MAQTINRDHTRPNAVSLLLPLLFAATVIIPTTVIVASGAKLIVPTLNYPATFSVVAVTLIVWAICLLKRATADG